VRNWRGFVSLFLFSYIFSLHSDDFVSLKGTRTNNIQEHRVDMYNSNDETSCDENEKKMKVTSAYIQLIVTLKAQSSHSLDHGNLY
jgi:3-dehydroquinate dehydratase